jgi:photosystem II stability/assembly factor-like uncharacterized protein
MKLQKLFISFFLLNIFFFLSFGNLYSQEPLVKLEQIKKPNFYDIDKIFNDYWSKIPEEQETENTFEGEGRDQFKRWESFWQRRTYPTGEFPNATDILRDWEQYKAKNNKNSTQSANWTLLGPFDNPQPVPGQGEQGLGRINRIRFDPNNFRIIWAGSAAGGVWKSVDDGKNWATFPFTQFLSIGVSDIAISPQNSNIVYVATGDCEPSYESYYSIGLIKTTNGGTDWQVTNLKYSLSDNMNVNRVLVHPGDPNIVIVGTSDGIYKSTDGGNTWALKQGGAFFIDMEFMPGNPNVIYASTKTWSGTNYVYKSSDNGESWKIVQTYSNSLRVALAVSLAEPNYVYSLVSNLNRGFQSLSLSVDGGENWDKMADPSTVNNILGWYGGTGNDAVKGQGEYDLCIAVSPSHGYEVYIGGINVWKSNNSGESFTILTDWTGGSGGAYVHADQHDLVFANYSTTLYSGNDGGIDRTTDGGTTWTNLTKGISNTQFYRLGCSVTNPNLIIAGSQDNGTRRLKSSTWNGINGGDGMEAAIDPTNENRMYCSIQTNNGQVLLKSGNGGSTFVRMLGQSETGQASDWITPYIINQQNPSILYAGFVDVWKLSNYGSTRSKISNFGGNQVIMSLALAPSDSNTLYTATMNDLHVTHDGGQTWNMRIYSGGPISCIAVDPQNPNRVWITKSNYTSGSKVYEYDGTTWKNISGNLPNVPVNCIVYQNGSPDRLYVGTDIGVFYSDYGSAYWEPYGSGMPNVIVYDLAIQYSTHKLRAATFGRGLWETDISNCNLPQPKITIIGDTTFCQGDSCILQAEDGFSNYNWTSGETTKSIIVKQSGAYSYVVNDTSGCSAKSPAIYVDVKTVNDLTITPVGKYPMCKGDSVQLNASLGFANYKWSTGETNRKITVYQPGTYSVTGTSSNGCTKTTEFTVVTSPAKPAITRYRNTLTSTDAFAYQWFLNDSIIPGATAQSYEITNDGTYKVEVFDKDSCFDISDSIFAILGVEDINQTQDYINIYPNPGTGIYNLNIKLKQPAKIEATLTNILGINVWSSVLMYNDGVLSQEIDIQNLPAGVYYLIIRYGSDSFIHKIVKE